MRAGGRVVLGGGRLLGVFNNVVQKRRTGETDGAVIKSCSADKAVSSFGADDDCVPKKPAGDSQ